MFDDSIWTVAAQTSRRRFTLLALVTTFLTLTSTAEAQRITAELSGTVVDEAGGVIPGAGVTLTNAASRSERHSVTNDDGFFAFSAVPAATYTVVVELQGFAAFEYTDIALGPGDSRRLRPIPLKVASRAETVSVSAEIELTPLDSGEKSATLDSDVIEDIPVVSSSVTELLRILPGMTPMTQGVSNQPNFTGETIGINGNGEAGGGINNSQSAIGNYSANGGSTDSFDITIDGAPGADPGCNCATSVNPNTEMVQEFKVLQASFGAEYAKGPSSITVVSKSGGRDFHGSAFLYFRDYHLNSNDWFGNKVGDPRPESRYLYPGFTVSGPLSFGSFNKERDKLFFFVGYEYYDQRLDTGYARTWVPTAEIRQGDFTNAAGVGSGSFVNTTPILNGVPTPIVPADMIDPGGQTLLDVFPLPNADPALTGGYNYVTNLVTSQPNHQLLTRLDWNISSSTKAFARYNQRLEVALAPLPDHLERHLRVVEGQELTDGVGIGRERAHEGLGQAAQGRPPGRGHQHSPACRGTGNQSGPDEGALARPRGADLGQQPLAPRLVPQRLDLRLAPEEALGVARGEGAQARVGAADLCDAPRLRRPRGLEGGQDRLQGHHHLSGRGDPIGRPLGQAAAHHGLERRWHRRHECQQARGLVAQDRRQDVPGRLALEGTMARDHLVQERPHREDVAPRIGLLPLHLLRRHVAEGPKNHPG
jgi:hypothetical protein